MYSQEERMAAVHTYINSNFNENYVIRTLGYPSPNALRSWYKEYKATGTLHEKSRPKPRYTQAQKEKAVSYYAEHRISITQACREMGYPHRDMLRAWIQEIRPDLFNKKQDACKKNSRLIRYTKEEKYAIVEEWMTSNIPVYQIAAKYGISKAVISKWKCEILGKDSKMPLQKDEEYWLPKETKESLQSEIVRLQSGFEFPHIITPIFVIKSVFILSVMLGLSIPMILEIIILINEKTKYGITILFNLVFVNSIKLSLVENTIPDVSASRNSVLAKPSLPVRKSFHGVAVYF